VLYYNYVYLVLHFMQLHTLWKSLNFLLCFLSERFFYIWHEFIFVYFAQFAHKKFTNITNINHITVQEEAENSLGLI